LNVERLQSFDSCIYEFDLEDLIQLFKPSIIPSLLLGRCLWPGFPLIRLQALTTGRYPLQSLTHFSPKVRKLL
jgi:hypothetical protein